ncbi:beta-lactamase superfamily II metal-dependent hydrolase [Pullulanibacillus pueri]|uniref:MBL fold protein n=1 Tax=Pullulanibacillus pueri TaxID=1437324 RepID=A0A8J3EMS1_9BACL|nr:MBL fold metallo-hydrolase [Pullulanibacillus pueri]MBM7683575.1 beta-lactamase superfamily II metal-dependent hydrolase [Pullulanibacillus pueri]GGH84483.1 MBL fold protein [Pullulanibacillus pueri]
MKKFILVLLCLFFVIPPQTTEAEEPKELQIHFIDVGQADSILIRTPQGKNILIDAGGKKSAVKLMNYLRAFGITTFDAVIATHPHHDHIGGMSAILENFTVKAFYMPDISHYTHAFNDLYTTVKKEGIMIFKAKAGNKIDVEPGVKINIIAPLKGNYDHLNDYSYVLKVIHNENSFLLMADAGEQSETELLEKKVNVKADVIKIGHHGADTSSTLPFLKKVNPDTAVISTGNRIKQGYPSKAVINRLHYLKIPTYRSDLLGTIVAHSDGHNITFTYGKSEQEHQEEKE